MLYTLNTTEEAKSKAIKAELAEQAQDLVAYVKQYHMLGDSFDYDTMRDKYHEYAAKNINEWDALTWAIDSAEYDLEHIDYKPDAEAGNPCAEWEAAYEKLTDLQDEAEEWADTFEHMLEDFFFKLYDLLYGEGE